MRVKSVLPLKTRLCSHVPRSQKHPQRPGITTRQSAPLVLLLVLLPGFQFSLRRKVVTSDVKVKEGRKASPLPPVLPIFPSRRLLLLRLLRTVLPVQTQVVLVAKSRETLLSPPNLTLFGEASDEAHFLLHTRAVSLDSRPIPLYRRVA